MKHIKKFEQFTDASNAESNHDNAPANEAKLQGAEWDLWADIDSFILQMKNKYRGKVKKGTIREFILEYVSDWDDKF
jgi:hypothetical protein